MTNKAILLSLLLLSSFNLFSQINQKVFESQIDSVDNLNLENRVEGLKYLFEELKDNSKTVETSKNLRRLSNRLYNVGEIESSYQINTYNVKVSKNVGDTITLAKNYKDLGDYFYLYSVNDSAFYYYQQALNYLKPDHKSYVQALIKKAELYKNENHFIEAEKVLVDAIRLAKRNNNIRQLYDAHVVLAITQNRLNNFDDALKSYEVAFSYLNDLSYDSQYKLLIAQTLNNEANVYVELKDFNKAIDNYNEALSLNVKKESDVLYAAILDNLAYAQFLANQGNPEPLFKESLSIRLAINNKLGIVVSKKRLGELYLHQKDTLLANQYLNEAYLLAKQTDFIKEMLDILQLKAKAKPINAGEYLRKHIQLKDSLLQVERITRDKFAKIELDTEEVINRNVQLNKKLSNFYVIALIAFVVLLLLYLFFKQRSKNKLLLLEKEQQQSNQEVVQLLLTQQQNVDQARRAEKDKLASELHDGIVSELFGTRIHIMHYCNDEDAKVAKEMFPYVDKLADLENKIRSLSHDLKSEHQFNSTGFDAILQNLFDEFEQLTHVKIKYSLASNIHWEELDFNIKINLYRIFQEALTNIRKYAKAKQVYIEVLKKDNKIEFSIKDDGIGFNTQKTSDGIGIKNLKFRMHNLNGTLKISSSSEGTQIQGTIPN